MTYKEVHEYLDSLLVFGVKLGLSNMQALCRLLGNPEESLDFIHVAGTNGKGSSCSMLASAMKNCGLRTGFYSSPFLYRFTERWRIDGEEVSEDQVIEAIEAILKVERQLVEETGAKPTYFEVLTAAALLIFKKSKVEVVIWETGMGGRLDATNIVTPLISLITNVELDHTQYLGNTLVAVASEKGGIIKPGIPVVCGDQKSLVVNCLEGLSLERGSTLICRSVDFDIEFTELVFEGADCYRLLTYRSNFREGVRVKLPALGHFQVENAGSVIAVLEFLSDKLNLDFDKACQGVEKFKWPGRMECRSNGLILDGAHNPVGALALVKTLDEVYPNKKFNFICGILADKDWESVLSVLEPKAESFYFVEISHARTSQAQELSDYVKNRGLKVLGVGLTEDALAQIEKPDNTIVVGSLYLIGEALSILNEGEPAQIDCL